MNLLQYTDFREYLQLQFKDRTEKNSLYSLRAFARDLGLSPTLLSRFFRGERGMSFETASMILESFTLDSIQKKFLLSSVLSQYARAKSAKEDARAELNQLSDQAYKILREDEFTVLRDWYHLAILTLMELSEFRSDFDWIGKRLNIHPETVALAIARMISLGIVERQGNRFVKKGSYLFAPQHSSEALREFHSRVLGQAAEAVQLQSPDQRLSASMYLSVSESQFEEAKAILKEFMVSFAKRFSTEIPRSNRDAVYAYSSHFFKISKTEDKGA